MANNVLKYVTIGRRTTRLIIVDLHISFEKSGSTLNILSIATLDGTDCVNDLCNSENVGTQTTALAANATSLKKSKLFSRIFCHNGDFSTRDMMILKFIYNMNMFEIIIHTP